MKIFKWTLVFLAANILISHAQAAECVIEAEVTQAKVTLADTKISVKISKISPINDVKFKGFNCNDEYKEAIEQSTLSYADERKTTLEQGTLIKGTVQSQLDDKTSDSRLFKVEITGKADHPKAWWVKIVDYIRAFLKI